VPLNANGALMSLVCMPSAGRGWMIGSGQRVVDGIRCCWRCSSWSSAVGGGVLRLRSSGGPNSANRLHDGREGEEQRAAGATMRRHHHRVGRLANMIFSLIQASFQGQRCRGQLQA
jgi:hypothetical protein